MTWTKKAPTKTHLQIENHKYNSGVSSFEANECLMLKFEAKILNGKNYQYFENPTGFDVLFYREETKYLKQLVFFNSNIFAFYNKETKQLQL